MKSESATVIDQFIECFKKNKLSIDAQKELIKLILEFQKAINVESLEIIENWREE